MRDEGLAGWCLQAAQRLGMGSLKGPPSTPSLACSAGEPCLDTNSAGVNFGFVPGLVSVGPRTLSCPHWDDSTIQCEAPAGVSPSIDVVVTAASTLASVPGPGVCLCFFSMRAPCGARSACALRLRLDFAPQSPHCVSPPHVCPVCRRRVCRRPAEVPGASHHVSAARRCGYPCRGRLRARRAGSGARGTLGAPPHVRCTERAACLCIRVCLYRSCWWL